MGNKSSNNPPVEGDWKVQSTGDFRIPGTPKIVYNAEMNLYADQYYVEFQSAKDYGKQCEIYRLRSGIMLSHLVEVVGLIHNEDYRTCSGKDYSATVMVQRIPWRLFLQPKNSLSLAEGLYILNNVLSGIEELCEGFDRSFLIYPEMIGINLQGCVKVWHNVNFSINYPDDTIQVTSIKPMIQVILDIIDSYVIHEQFREFSSRIYKIGALSFVKVKQEVQQYLTDKKIFLSVSVGIKIINRGYEFCTSNTNNQNHLKNQPSRQNYSHEKYKQHIKVQKNEICVKHIKNFIQQHRIVDKSQNKKKSIRKSLSRESKSVRKIVKQTKNYNQIDNININRFENNFLSNHYQTNKNSTNQYSANNLFSANKYQQNNNIQNLNKNNHNIEYFNDSNVLQNSTHTNITYPHNKISHQRTRSQNIQGKAKNSYQNKPDVRIQLPRDQSNHKIQRIISKERQKSYSQLHTQLSRNLSIKSTIHPYKVLPSQQFKFNNIDAPIPTSYVKFTNTNKTYIRTTRLNTPLLTNYNQIRVIQMSPDPNGVTFKHKPDKVKFSHELNQSLKIQSFKKQQSHVILNPELSIRLMISFYQFLSKIRILLSRFNLYF